MTLFTIIRNSLRLIFLSLLCISVNTVLAQEHEHDEHEGEHEGEHEEEHKIEISPELAERYGLGTATAEAGTLNLTLLLYGRTVPDPQQVSHVSARYPGMIRSIGPSLGDSVEAGEVIAVVESNASLQRYNITAPLSGTVVDKHANPGEMTGNDPLLTIANYQHLWVDLSVFPGDATRIRAGQSVTVRLENLQGDSTISYLNPGEGRSPAVIARVPLPNPELHWTPGLLVEGSVSIDTINVDLRVDNRALQTMDGEQVVFVKDGNHYEPHVVEVGRTDGRYTEILEGLEANTEYVVENSYLLKADLEKEGAAHEH